MLNAYSCWYLIASVFPQKVSNNLMKVGRIARLHSFSYVFLFLIRVLLWGKKKRKKTVFVPLLLCICVILLNLFKKSKGLEKAQW